MKQTIKHFTVFSAGMLGSIGLAIAPAMALSASGNGGTTQPDTAKLQTIISKGDTEITRRLATLNNANSKLAAAAKLSSTDKTTLTNEINSEISGLTALKTKLDAETSVAAARADAQSIFDDYRVYALVVPKAWLTKTADDQQVTESRLTTLSGKLQAAITKQQQAGKDVSALQTKLDDLNTQVQTAQTVSAAIGSKVINLQPSDYNTDHGILSGDRDQLKAAQANLASAISDAKAIISGLKNL